MVWRWWTKQSTPTGALHSRPIKDSNGTTLRSTRDSTPLIRISTPHAASRGRRGPGAPKRSPLPFRPSRSPPGRLDCYPKTGNYHCQELCTATARLSSRLRAEETIKTRIAPYWSRGFARQKRTGINYSIFEELCGRKMHFAPFADARRRLSSFGSAPKKKVLVDKRIRSLEREWIVYKIFSEIVLKHDVVGTQKLALEDGITSVTNKRLNEPGMPDSRPRR